MSNQVLLGKSTLLVDWILHLRKLHRCDVIHIPYSNDDFQTKTVNREEEIKGIISSSKSRLYPSQRREDFPSDVHTARYKYGWDL